jgi:hypothetical protein
LTLSPLVKTILTIRLPISMNTFRKRRIAFVFLPHVDPAAYIRLETMPFAMHVLKRLVAGGWYIDIFVWDQAGYSYEDPTLPERVRLNCVKMRTKWGRLHPAELIFRFFRCVAYACVFSVGQRGGYVGGIISTASRCPHIMLNDEFPSFWGCRVWAALERWSAHRADVVIVPSDDRQSPLREEFRLDDHKPFVTLRNTPEVAHPVRNIDWHSRLRIPHDRKIFMNAGTVADWAQIPELLTSVAYWPEDSVLLLQNKSRVRSTCYRQELSHLDNPSRIFWNAEPLSEELLHSLISYCTGSFALYRNRGPNFELVGTSSGKLMRSIACGTPVITSSFTSLNFVSKEGLGIQVKHPSEIPFAVDNLKRNIERYRQRCLTFSVQETSLRNQAWARIAEHIRASRQLDLSSPPGEPRMHEFRMSERGF